MNKNILILSAGRRVELVNCFRNAVAKLKKSHPEFGSKIVAADLSTLAPAGYFADAYVNLPRIGAYGYIDALIKIIREQQISLVVPTIDTELLILAGERKRLESETEAKILVSDIPVVETCRDKIHTCHYLMEHGFDIPKLITEEDIQDEALQFPLFIKPLNGSSSVNAFKVNNRKELSFFRDYIEEPIIQEYISGEEYSVDVFLDFESNIISIVPRLRMAVRSGEILKGKIVKDQGIIESVKKLMEQLKPIGHITVQCIKTGEKIKYIEINPRFGGGAPMSIMSGADSCVFLYRLLLGEQLNYQENYRDGDIYLRFDQSICVDAEGERVNIDG